MVVNQVKIEDEDSLDVLFWLSKTASVRKVAGLHARKPDSLSSVIRSKKDVDQFMSEIESVVKSNRRAIRQIGET